MAARGAWITYYLTSDREVMTTGVHSSEIAAHRTAQEQTTPEKLVRVTQVEFGVIINDAVAFNETPRPAARKRKGGRDGEVPDDAA